MKRYDFDHANWGSRSKITYRDDCIIKPYRQYYQRKSIPCNRQYWTMCGNHITNTDTIRVGAELPHLLDRGLFTAKQFVGVDNGDGIISNNARCIPQSTWIHGDFVETLHECDDFRPAIIHIDTVSMSTNAWFILDGTIRRVQYCSWPVMVTINVIAKRWMDKRESDGSEIINKLMAGLPSRWSICQRLYKYTGVLSSSRTRMLALVLFYQGK